MRSEVKGKVDNDHQHDCADNPGGRSAQRDHDCRKDARIKCNNVKDDCSLRHGLGLDFKGNFHAPSNSNGGEERRKPKEVHGQCRRRKLR
jgi:hypothetical protein